MHPPGERHPGTPAPAGPEVGTDSRSEGPRAAAWVLLAALTGLAASGIFSGMLGWRRDRFVLGFLLLAVPFLAAFVRALGLDPGIQLRRRWRAGLVGGLLVGAFLVGGVLRQPGSAAPVGAGLGGALLWQGLVYGTLDALLLTIVPVIAVYGTRPPGSLGRSGARLGWGLAALAASLLVTAAYHAGFAEFRGSAMVQPLIGNAVVTLAYLLTGNPLAPWLAHVMMHGAAVLHGPATTVQLPPHY